MEPTAGVEPAPAPYEGAVLPATLRRHWSRLEDSNLDSPVIGRKSCRWTKPGGIGCRAGIRTRIFPRNRRTCYLIATTLQEMVGSGGLEPPRTCARGRWAT